MMPTKYSKFFYALCLLRLIFSHHMLVYASDEELMKTICLVLRFKSTNALCEEEIEKVNETTVTNTRLKLIEDGKERYSDGALCNTYGNEIRCIIDDGKENEFIDYMYKDEEKACFPDAETKTRSKKEYSIYGNQLKTVRLEEEISMRRIYLALYYECTKKLSTSAIKNLKTRVNVFPLKSTDNDIERDLRGGVFYWSATETRCLINDDNADEFMDYIYLTKSKCAPDSKTKKRSKSEYLKKGKQLEAYLLNLTLPKRELPQGKAICDDEKSMKKICVGLRKDHYGNDSFEEKKSTEKQSKCLPKNQNEDTYEVALCHLQQNFQICIIDGYNEDEFFSSYYLTTTKTCNWESDITVRSKKEYLTIGNAASQSPQSPQKPVTETNKSEWKIVRIFRRFIKCFTG